VAASKLPAYAGTSLPLQKQGALGMVNAGEAIPKLVPAKAGTALEAATLPSYQIKFDRLLVLCQGSNDGLSFPRKRESRLIDGNGFRIKCGMTSLKARLTEH